MRKRVWFRLSRLDRALVCLSLLRKTVISEYLRSRLAIVVMRLEALLNPVTVHVRQRLANLVQVAQSWGHKTAKAWLQDRKFMQYLAVMEMNT